MEILKFFQQNNFLQLFRIHVAHTDKLLPRKSGGISEKLPNLI
jgi:hypothetical protein